MQDVKPEVLSETRFGQRQGYTLRRVVAVSGHKIRVTVYRDAYDFQSRLVAQRWDGETWQEVATIDGSELVAKSGPSYVLWERNRSDCEEWQDRMADRLLAETLDVIL